MPTLPQNKVVYVVNEKRNDLFFVRSSVCLCMYVVVVVHTMCNVSKKVRVEPATKKPLFSEVFLVLTMCQCFYIVNRIERFIFPEKNLENLLK